MAVIEVVREELSMAKGSILDLSRRLKEGRFEFERIAVNGELRVGGETLISPGRVFLSSDDSGH